MAPGRDGDGGTRTGDGVEDLADGEAIGEDILGNNLFEHSFGTGICPECVKEGDGWGGIVEAVGGDEGIVDVVASVHDLRLVGTALAGETHVVTQDVDAAAVDAQHPGEGDDVGSLVC